MRDFDFSKVDGFEWDSAKDAESQLKHGVGFEEAATAFRDLLSVTVPDPEHSRGASRYALVGVSYRRRLVVVVHTERRDTIRIISARRATRRERRTYEEAQQET